MSQSETRKYTAVVRANNKTLGPFDTEKEAKAKGHEESERAIVAWSRALLERLTKEPELLRKVVALLALPPFDYELSGGSKSLEILPGFVRPKSSVAIKQAGCDGQLISNPFPEQAFRERITAAILALDLDKE